MRTLFVLTLASITLACSAGSSTGSSDDDYTARPTAGSTTLRVTNPLNAQLTKVVVQRKSECAETGCPEIPVALDTDVALTAGTYCIRTEVSASSNDGSEPSCTLTLAAGTATTYQLAAVRFVRSNNEKVALVDGPLSEWTSSRGRFLRNQDPVAHPAGAVSYALYGRFDAVEVDAAEGQLTTVDLDAVADRYAVRFRCEAGTLPDAHPNSVTAPRLDLVAPGVIMAALPQSCSGATWLARFVRAPQGNLTFGPTSVPLPIGAPGAPVPELLLHRLEVAKPKVTQGDGSIVEVDASVSVSASGSSSAFAKFAAGAGINLPSGTWTTVTEFTSPIDDTPVRQKREVTLPEQ